MLTKAMRNTSLLILFALIPVFLMAMTPAPDSLLAGVCGQAGVNINADITMNVHMDTMAWGDNDGVRDSAWSIMPEGGYVGVTGFDIYNLRIKARETDTYNGYNSWSMLKPITIDVATDPTYAVYNGATFVRIGFGSLQITADHMHFAVQLGRYPFLDQMLGEVNIGALGVYINPVSYVDLYNPRPGSRCGIFMTTYFVIDRIDIGYLSWGDTDGLPGGSQGEPGGVGDWIGASNSGGYIGIQDFAIGGPVTIAGTVAIDVTSAWNGVYASVIAGQPVTVVHILFTGPFIIDVAGPITGNIRLDSAAYLGSADAHTLGDIYMQDVSLVIRHGSWVDIWAH